MTSEIDALRHEIARLRAIEARYERLIEHSPEASGVDAVREPTEQRDRERQQNFLREFSYVVFSTLDFDERLRGAVEFSVRDFADWCAVDVQDGGVWRRVTAAHADPALRDQSRGSLERLPPFDMFSDPPRAPANAGLSLWLPRIGDESLRQHVSSDAYEILVGIPDAISLIVVPLAARGVPLGAITFVSARREYTRRDVDFAQEIARTLELSADNARLYREAQLAITVRDDVLAAVSHDLKNPLAAIQLATQVFQRKFQLHDDGAPPIPPVQAQRLIQTIERAAHRAVHLIRDLLEFSKVTSGTLTVTTQPVGVGQILSESLDVLNLLALERSLELRWETDVPALKVSCEPDRIQQVLSNLIGNAIKFTPPGGVIDVRAERRDHEVHFSVRDTGPGIRAEDIRHLFERYWQAKETQKMGSGLGLPICKAIIDAHGGRLWAESRVGEGSVFFFTIPLATGE